RGQWAVMGDGTWLLYGANGYTGRLIAEEAVRRGMRPVLAGRREAAVRPLAERLRLPYRIFGLDDMPAERLADEMGAVDVVLLAAGPFSATSGPVVEACLATGTHYLDITGEIDVFESVFRRHAAARSSGCVLLPGVGFDVVPTDCLAAALSASLPGARLLELAWAGGMRPTSGTARTTIEALPDGGAVREEGSIRREPIGRRTLLVPFRDRSRLAMSVPWGDVATAYHSTGIPDIVVYTAVPPVMARAVRLGRTLLPLLRGGGAQRALHAAAGRWFRGPGPEQRRSGRTHLWGRVRDAGGEERSATLETPEPYHLTVLTALEAVRLVVDGQVEPGAQTPSLAFGADFITSIPGCDISPGA
ncbi:MAG: saccharopine dehydrogenase family protein, partial [Streptosporangiaceae bacterium]